VRTIHIAISIISFRQGQDALLYKSYVRYAYILWVYSEQQFYYPLASCAFNLFVSNRLRNASATVATGTRGACQLAAGRRHHRLHFATSRGLSPIRRGRSCKTSLNMSLPCFWTLLGTVTANHDWITIFRYLDPAWQLQHLEAEMTAVPA
jgi:hypothetical protein